jgi:hypothetical protein
LSIWSRPAHIRDKDKARADCAGYPMMTSASTPRWDSGFKKLGGSLLPDHRA